MIVCHNWGEDVLADSRKTPEPTSNLRQTLRGDSEVDQGMDVISLVFGQAVTELYCISVCAGMNQGKAAELLDFRDLHVTGLGGNQRIGHYIGCYQTTNYGRQHDYENLEESPLVLRDRDSQFGL